MLKYGLEKWKILSISLMIALGVSLGINVYSALSGHGTQSNGPLEFTFTWGSNAQKIVNGTFVLTLKISPDAQNLTLVATANDDEYDQFDYLGLVFDTNQNGHIDISDQAIGLWADNFTVKSDLQEYGLLAFSQAIPVRGPQNVTFDASTGYTFTVDFPFFYPTKPEEPWFDPGMALVQGMNQLHVCFYDDNATELGQMNGVFSRFSFELTK